MALDLALITLTLVLVVTPLFGSPILSIQNPGDDEDIVTRVKRQTTGSEYSQLI